MHEIVSYTEMLEGQIKDIEPCKEENNNNIIYLISGFGGGILIMVIIQNVKI